MEWSNYQIDIFDATKNTKNNLSVQAVAGSGKTTTLCELAAQCKDKVLFLAFNKDIAAYAKRKMPEFVDCRTFHSYGLGLLKQEIGWYPQVNGSKVYDCVKSRHPYVKGEWSCRSVLNRVVRTMRNLGFMSYDEEDIEEFMYDYASTCFSYNPKESPREKRWASENIPEIAAVLRVLDQLPKRGEVDPKNEWQYVIDFNDMVRYPCIYDLALKKRLYMKVALVDEAQDMNPYQWHLIRQLFAKNIRIIAVGDSNQAIYAFRGAFHDSMERMADLTNAVELPLSYTYRCKSEIVEFVNNEIPKSTMEYYFEGGEVLPGRLKSEFVQLVKEHKVPMIIGAKNKSLIKAWVLLARHKIASSLKGSGITDEIRRILKDFNFERIGVEQLLKDMEEAIQKGLVADEETGTLKQTMPPKITDIFWCIQELIEIHEITQPYEFMNLLLEMDKDADHELHTVHSSKGLEANAVIVLCDWFENDQLSNMQYVAYTRASDLLITISNWEREEDETPNVEPMPVIEEWNKKKELNPPLAALMDLLPGAELELEKIAKSARPAQKADQTISIVEDDDSPF